MKPGKYNENMREREGVFALIQSVDARISNYGWTPLAIGHAVQEIRRIVAWELPNAAG